MSLAVEQIVDSTQQRDSSSMTAKLFIGGTKTEQVKKDRRSIAYE